MCKSKHIEVSSEYPLTKANQKLITTDYWQHCTKICLKTQSLSPSLVTWSPTRPHPKLPPCHHMAHVEKHGKTCGAASLPWIIPMTVFHNKISCLHNHPASKSMFNSISPALKALTSRGWLSNLPINSRDWAASLELVSLSIWWDRLRVQWFIRWVKQSARKDKKREPLGNKCQEMPIVSAF